MIIFQYRNEVNSLGIHVNVINRSHFSLAQS